MVEKKETFERILKIIILTVIGLCSYCLLSKKLTDFNTYQSVVSYIDSQKTNVTALASSSTILSAAITLIPGDTLESIANSLAQLSDKFLFVLIILYLEKYLLTIIGAFVSKILLPVACILEIGYQITRRNIFFSLGIKIAVLSIALVTMIPTGVKVSKMIEETYELSIQETIEAADETIDEIYNTEEIEDVKSKNNNEPGGVLDSLKNIYITVKDIAKNIANDVSDSIKNTLSAIKDLPTRIATIFNNFVEAAAVLIVTSCVIPLLVVFFFLWIVKILFGIDFKTPPAKIGLSSSVNKSIKKRLNADTRAGE